MRNRGLRASQEESPPGTGAGSSWAYAIAFSNAITAATASSIFRGESL
jgi:hypothetical protein